MTLQLATMAGSTHGAPTGGAPGSAAADVEVVAVVVVHDGARWLPRALSSLAGSDRRPDRVVAVDAGSTDRSPVLLDTAAGPAGGTVLDAVVAGRRDDGLGASVARGLRAADALPGAPAPGDGDRRRQWVWLLHDDCAPAPDTLDVLLSAVTAAPTIAVAGCKQRGWDDPDALVEIGVTTSHGGRRITDLAEGELDQGQHDDRADVLAVSTAGMLVRRDVWDAVGGLDPALPLVADDIDFCLRVRRAGHRVAVVPDAVVRHAGALGRGHRAPDALRGGLGRRLLGRPGPEDLPLTERRRALHLRLVHCHVLALLPLLVWVVAAAPLRAVGQLVRRRPALAVVELLAVIGLLLTPWRVLAARRRARRGRVVGTAAVRPMLRSRRRVLRDDLDAWRQRRAARRGRRVVGDQGDEERELLAALESGPVDDTAVGMVLTAPRPLRRVVAHPLTYLLPLLLGLGLVLRLAGERVRVTGVPYAVDGLSAADLLARAAAGWRDVGTGVAAVGDPAVWVWALLTAATSLMTTGSPTGSSLGTVHAVVTLAAPAAALLVAYPALRRLSSSTAGAVPLSVTWALLPWTGLLGPVTPGTLLVHVLLPGLGAALFGCLGHRSVRSAGVAALLSTVVVALLPAAWPVLLVAGAVVGILAGSSSSASLRAALPVLAVGAPVLVWASWAGAVVRRPEILLLGPDLADPASPVLRTALGGEVDRTPVAGLDPYLVLLVLLGTFVVLVAALCAVSLSGRRQVAAWSAAVVGLSAVAVGWAAAGTQVSVTGSAGAGPWSLLWLPVLGIVALLLRRTVAGRRGRPGRRRRVPSLVSWSTSLLLPLLLLLPVVAVPFLVTEPEPARGLPLAAAVDARSPQQTRTLVLDVSAAAGGTGPTVTWWVGRGEPGLGQDSVAALLQRRSGATPSADARLARLVGALLGRPATTPEALTTAQGAPTAPDVAAADVVPQLAAAGIGWVVVDVARGTDPALGAVVDEALATRSGMVATSAAGPRTSWRVDPGADAPAPARARVVAADGTAGDPLDVRAPVALEAGAPGRRLVLAEAAQPGWTATVDGVTLLPSDVGGWAQGFLLPAGPGTLEVEPPGSGPVPGGLAVVTVLLLAGAVLWPWQGRHRMVLRRGPSADVAGPPLRSGLGGAARAALGAPAARSLLLGGLAGAGGVPWLPGTRPTEDLPATTPPEVTPRPRGTTPVALASPAQQVACPGPTAGLVPEGGSGTDADPGTTGVTSAEELGAVPLGEGGVPEEARRGLQLTVATDGDLRGAALTSCAGSAVTSWVMLSGTGVGERPTVILDNPSDTSALVDVRALTPDGPAEATAGSGLLVPAGEQVAVAVDALVLDAAAVLVEVTARQGSVAVTGVDTALQGLVPQGRAEVAATTEASTEVVVPSLRVVPDVPGTASLRLGSVDEEPGWPR